MAAQSSQVRPKADYESRACATVCRGLLSPGVFTRTMPDGASGYGHLYKTTNGGASWTNVSGNLPDVPVNDVLMIGSTILLATDLGVVVSTDGGARWSRLGGTCRTPRRWTFIWGPTTGYTPPRMDEGFGPSRHSRSTLRVNHLGC